MATKIRLSRKGAKKAPFYRIVVADSRAPRDGKFIEIVGTYNPLLAKDNEERVKFKADRLQYWLSTGAQPTEKTEKLIKVAGLSKK
jgi:small subunit ribosomal protein S16